MTTQHSFLDQVLIESASILSPLRQLDDVQRVTALFKELGYELPGAALIQTDLSSFLSLIDLLIDQVEALGSGDTKETAPLEILNLMAAAQDVISEVDSLHQTVKDELDDIAGFWSGSNIEQTLARRLLDYLLCIYIETRQLKLFRILTLLGLVELQDQEADDSAFQPAFTLRIIHWDRLPLLFSQPKQLFETVYQWETDFDSEKFLSYLEALIRAFSLPGGLYLQSETVKQALGQRAEEIKELRIPLIQARPSDDSYVQFGVSVGEAPENSDAKKGLAILPYAYGDFEGAFDTHEDFDIELEASSSIGGGLGLILRPPTSVQALTSIFTSPAESLEFDLDFSISQKTEKYETLILLGSKEGSHLGLEGFGFKAYAKHETALTLGSALTIKAIKLVIQRGEGDGFIKKVLPVDPIEMEVELGLGYDTEKGFYLEGGAGLEYSASVNLPLGPLMIKSMFVGISLDDEGIDSYASTTISLMLGPFSAIIEQIGLTAGIEFNTPGILGNADLSFGFKPPKGIGLSLDASAIKGGGYLYIDAENGRYYGAAELVVKETFALSAVAIINTQLPDGSEGYSFLLLISAEFSPIPLAYGFTLNGVGGLIGLHRSMNVEALRDGVRSGGIDHILFPTHVVANIDQIITDLETCFPIAQGRYAFGLMAIIGWGQPTILTIELGLLIEVPDPVSIAIIGVLKTQIPDEKLALISLNVAFLGTIDFDQKMLAFDATIYNSRLLQFTLEGDMSVRLSWGEHKEFLLSVGGFHPSYEPAESLGIPAMKRITVNFLAENPRLTLTSYFAITSNTVQFGGKIDFHYELQAAYTFQIVGFMGMDTLFQFSPFYFRVDIAALLAVIYNDKELLAVSLDITLQGPTPWQVQGTAKFKAFGITVPVSIDKRFGQDSHTVLSDESVIPLLAEALEHAANWQSTLPESQQQWAIIRETEVEAGTIFTLPSGDLHISQHIVPLDREISKFGQYTPADGNLFQIDGISVEGNNQSTDDVHEYFAPAIYSDLSDADKLSAPSFAEMKSGVKVIDSGDLMSAPIAKREIDYEWTMIDETEEKSPEFLKISPSLSSRFTKAGSTSKSIASKNMRMRSAKSQRRAKVQYSEISKAS